MNKEVVVRITNALALLSEEQGEALAWMAEQRIVEHRLDRAKGAGVEVDTPELYAYALTRQAFVAVEGFLELGAGASVSPAGIRARAGR
jgi:hypothetical protein